MNVVNHLQTFYFAKTSGPFIANVFKIRSAGPLGFIPISRHFLLTFPLYVPARIVTCRIGCGWL